MKKTGVHGIRNNSSSNPGEREVRENEEEGIKKKKKRQFNELDLDLDSNKWGKSRHL